MPSPAVTIVVVSWNGKHLLQECLPSIQRQTFTDFEIIVVDNGSTDGSIEFLRAFPSVQVIALPENQGFAGPNNLAFERAKGSWIATINNDLTLSPDWLQILVDALEKEPDCFAVQGRILKDAEPNLIDTCGLGIRACGAARNLGHNKPADSITTARPVFTVSAGAAVYRRSMLEQIGFFEASYFAYYEDLDAGWRARTRGWRSVLVPQAVAYHKVHGTSGSLKNDRLWYLSERNRLRTLVRNLPIGVLLRHPFRIALDELRYVDMIRKKAKFGTLLKARFSVLWKLIPLWRKRMPELKHVSSRDWEEWIRLSEDSADHEEPATQE